MPKFAFLLFPYHFLDINGISLTFWKWAPGGHISPHFNCWPNLLRIYIKLQNYLLWQDYGNIQNGILVDFISCTIFGQNWQPSWIFISLMIRKQSLTNFIIFVIPPNIYLKANFVHLWQLEVGILKFPFLAFWHCENALEDGVYPHIFISILQILTIWGTNIQKNIVLWWVWTRDLFSLWSMLK